MRKQRLRQMARLAGLLAGSVVLALAGPSSAQVSPLADRSPYYEPGATTSDDVQRVPVPPGYNEPAGGFVIVGGRLFDGTGAAARPATIVVRGKSIVAILPPGSRDWPADFTVHDVAGATVMPGLIDLHTHLSYVEQFGRPLPVSDHNQSEGTMRALRRLQIYALSGVTSVRDVASHGEIPFTLKRWQAQGRIAAPRVFPAGQGITARGGHGTEGFFLPTAPDYPLGVLREASGPDAWRDAVRWQFKQGADVIKLLSHYTQAEIDAAVDEAHMLGLPVTVDAETRYVDMAIQAGVDAIEHPLPRSDAAIAQMARRGIAAVPTIIPYRIITRSSGGYFGSTSRRFSLNEATIMAMLRKMIRARVIIGVGTDLIGDWIKYMPHAYIDELTSLVEAGMTRSEALVAATRTSARILRMDDRLGTIAPGMLADIIVIDGRPDEQLADLAKVRQVFVNGRLIVDRGALIAPAFAPTPLPAPRPAARGNP